MFASLRYPVLRTIAVLALFLLPGQTDSSVAITNRAKDGEPIAVLGESNRFDPGTRVPITRLDPRPCPSCPFTYNGGVRNSRRLVIRNQDAWRGVWKEINEPRLAQPPPPEIDFSHEMVVVVSLGQKPTGGYSIMVDRAYEIDDQLEIVVVSRSPEHNCVLTQAFTAPVDIALLPKIEGTVAFKDVQTVNDCGRSNR